VKIGDTVHSIRKYCPRRVYLSRRYPVLVLTVKAAHLFHVGLRLIVSSALLCYDLMVLGRTRMMYEASTGEGRRFFCGAVRDVGSDERDRGMSLWPVSLAVILA
jgi:hypothetical protein